MNKILTALSLSALLITPAFAKTKIAKQKPVAAETVKPAEGGAPAAEKKEEVKPTKKKGGKKAVKKAEGGEAKGAEKAADAKPAEAAPAK